MVSFIGAHTLLCYLFLPEWYFPDIPRYFPCTSRILPWYITILPWYFPGTPLILPW